MTGYSLREARASVRPYRCQLQMPPDRHGQVWIRVSRACASSGFRAASPVLRGRRLRRLRHWLTRRRHLGFARLCAGLSARSTCSPHPCCRRRDRPLPRSEPARTGPPGRAALATAPPWKGRARRTRPDDIRPQSHAAQRQKPGAKQCNKSTFQDHQRPPEINKNRQPPSCRKPAAQFQPVLPARLPVNHAGRENFPQPAS